MPQQLLPKGLPKASLFEAHGFLMLVSGDKLVTKSQRDRAAADDERAPDGEQRAQCLVLAGLYALSRLQWLCQPCHVQRQA